MCVCVCVCVCASVCVYVCVALHGRNKKQILLCTSYTDSDNADDIGLLANTPPAESLLHSMEKPTGVIGLYVNTNKWRTCPLIKTKEETSSH